MSYDSRSHGLHITLALLLRSHCGVDGQQSPLDAYLYNLEYARHPTNQPNLHSTRISYDQVVDEAAMAGSGMDHQDLRPARPIRLGRTHAMLRIA